MALDGLYLRLIKNEIEEKALFGKVDKVNMPLSDELIIHLRGKSGTYKLLLNIGGSCQRITLSEDKAENPKVPPMFCMLLRKHLCGGTLTGVRQNGLDRVLFFDFSVINELGDRVSETLAAELTGRVANIILVAENGKIIDAARRTDLTENNARSILPGAVYIPLARQEKEDITDVGEERVFGEIIGKRDMPLHDSIMSSMEGMSPRSAASLAENVCDEKTVGELTDAEKDLLCFLLGGLKKRLSGETRECCYMLSDEAGKPREFGVILPKSYPAGYSVMTEESPSGIIEQYFGEKIKAERMSVYKTDLHKIVKGRLERLYRKTDIQKKELAKSLDREKYRIMGELITANIYRINKGDSEAVVENYYAVPPENIVIKLDKRYTPSQNAQRYYKEYNKLTSAEKMLTIQIENGKSETEYLESVLDEIERIESESDARGIKAELTETGYIRAFQGKKKTNDAGEYITVLTTDGYEVLIGRNNIQNDRLTFKVASGGDMWLHTQKIHGSHVIIRRGNHEDFSEQAIYEAACLAARHSKGASDGKVSVDYTLRKFVKKPPSAKPGMVIYTDYKTITVDIGVELLQNK